MLVVKRPDTPPTMKSLIRVGFTLKFSINSNVNINSSMLTPILNAAILMEIKIIIPKGTPTILPIINLFIIGKSMSFLIFHINETEIIKDKIIFICIASCGRNNINKKGVAIMENPKPVLVCRIDATNIIQKKDNTVPKLTSYKFNPI